MKNGLDKNLSCRSGLRENHKMIRWLRRITLVYWIALTYLLLAPDPMWFLSMPDGMDDPHSLNLPDLVQHFLALGLLGVLLTCQMNRQSMTSLSFGIAVAYSIGTELVQMFVPDRFASVLDVLANLSGLATGWVVVQLFRGVTVLRRSRTSNAISS